MYLYVPMYYHIFTALTTNSRLTGKRWEGWSLLASGGWCVAYCHKLQRRCLKVKGSAVWWCRWLKHGFVNNKLAINILFDDPLYFLKNDQPRSFVGCRCAFHSMKNWQILSCHDPLLTTVLLLIHKGHFAGKF